MDTPLHPVRRTRAGRRWLSRLAALVLLGSSAAGCQGFTSFMTPAADPAPAPAPAGGVVPVKAESPLIDWPDWEWEDFDPFGILPKSSPETAPSDGSAVKGDGKTPVLDVATKMAMARELFAAQDYVRAAKIFHRIGDNEKNQQKVVAEAKFFEAECHYFLDEWPKAGDTYMALLNKVPRNEYRDKALSRMFEIANFWLDDTREEMREYKEKEDGQRMYVMPRFVSFEKKKPLLDREGRAIQLLEAIHYASLNDPISIKALYLCGSVKFFNEEYKEADVYFTQIAEKRGKMQTKEMSEMIENALKFAIIAKHLSTGGPDYDSRKVAEARKLVHDAEGMYPDLKNFLDKQLASITLQQAEKDFKMAEFYEHQGHPGPAVFYYELVTRRYVGVEPLCTEAAKRREEILRKTDPERLAEPAPHNPNQPIEQAPAPRTLPADLTPGR